MEGGAKGANEGEEEEKVEEEEEEEEEEERERLAQREGRRRWAGQAGREKFLRAGRGEGVEPAGEGAEARATPSYGETNELTFRTITPLLRKCEVISQRYVTFGASRPTRSPLAPEGGERQHIDKGREEEGREQS